MKAIAIRPDGTLLKVEEASQMLAKCVRVDEAKSIRDKAEAIQIYLRRQKASLGAINDAAEIKLRAERRLGELLEPAKEKRGGAKYQHVTLPSDVSRKQSSHWQGIARIPEPQFVAYIATSRATQGEKITTTGALRIVKEEARETKRDENQVLVEKAPDPAALEGIYSTIVIDPPWDWGDEGDADQLGRARPTYSTMSFEELLAFPAVPKAAAPDCHLYLWITNRSLPKGFGLLERWGFRYVTCLTWCKPSFGMGNYYRGSTEHVLFGVRGSLPLKRKDVGTWFAAPRAGRHSAKPEEFYGLIETCSPGPYLDIFARSARPGWVSYGAEAPGAA